MCAGTVYTFKNLKTVYNKFWSDLEVLYKTIGNRKIMYSAITIGYVYTY